MTFQPRVELAQVNLPQALITNDSRMVENYFSAVILMSFGNSNSAGSKGNPVSYSK